MWLFLWQVLPRTNGARVLCVVRELIPSPDDLSFVSWSSQCHGECFVRGCSRKLVPELSIHVRLHTSCLRIENCGDSLAGTRRQSFFAPTDQSVHGNFGSASP